MRDMRRFRLTALISVALAGGCSLVNSIDDVKPADDGTYNGVPRPDASVKLDEAGTIQLQDSGGGDAGQTGQPHEVMVVGGEVSVGDAGARSPVLTVLDPTTGHEIATRETMWVAGIAHDPDRDLWYIFEAADYFIAGPIDGGVTPSGVNLHIRSFDSAAGAWTERAVMKNIAPTTYYDAIAVTTSRVSYIAQPAPGATVPRLVTIDTTNPASPAVIDTQALAIMPRGMVATRSTTGSGGYLTLMNVYNAAADGPVTTGGACNTYNDAGIAAYTVCTTTLRHYQLPNGGVPVLRDIQEVIPDGVLSSASPAYANVICNGPDNVFVLPNGGPKAGTQSLYAFDYTQTTMDGHVDFAMSTAVAVPSTLRKAAVDNKRRLVFVVETNSDTNVYSVSLADNSVAKKSMRHSGQSVYYEPASETVFAPFNQGEGYTFSPFKVSGTNTLAERASGASGDWNPPDDLRPFVLGIRDPSTETCQL